MRLLIVRLGAMGDILHALPAIAALHTHLQQHAPGSSIDWLVEPHWQPLLSPELVDQIHLADTRRWRREPLAPATRHALANLRRQLRARGYDLALDLQGSLKSAALGRFAGSPVYVGPAQPREAPARLFYRQPAVTRATHVIQQACELASAALTQAGLPSTRLAPLSPALPHDIVAEAAVTARLAALGLEHDLVLLAPTAGWPAKQWPAAHYRMLAAALAARGLTVLVNASSPYDRIAAVVAGEGHAHLFPVTLPELIALTRRVRLVVAGDTGPLHLAAALRRPALGLFGPTDPARNGPDFPGAPVHVLRSVASVTSHRRRAPQDPGLASITVEEVLDASLLLLQDADYPA